jgi:hypothetical protein
MNRYRIELHDPMGFPIFAAEFTFPSEGMGLVHSEPGSYVRQAFQNPNGDMADPRAPFYVQVTAL